MKIPLLKLASLAPMMVVVSIAIPIENTVVCAQQAGAAVDLWMKQGLSAAFPAHYAEGVVCGKKVVMKSAIYRTLSGELLLEGDGYSLSILLPAGEPQQGKTLLTGVVHEITFYDTAKLKPARGYSGQSAATKLSLGKIKNNLLPGYVIVRCVDDKQRKQFIEGYFYATVRRGMF